MKPNEKSLSIVFATLLAICGMSSTTLAKGIVRAVCFVPSDRSPLPAYEERLDRVMKEVQQFYAKGMAEADYPNRGFKLELDETGKTRIHLVHGAHPAGTYGREAWDAVRNEVKAGLKTAGLDMDQETVVIFQVLLDWDGDKATEVGPYVGAGSPLSGTAWVYDDAKLDPKLLPSTEPGGWYGGPCSIGEFNSHYIGGVAHELGHAFGLPHACQRKADCQRGAALMGHGNHTYGQQLRNEGPGTFLTQTSAMMLACTRPFAGNLPQAGQHPKCEIIDIQAAFSDGILILSGKIEASPAVYGIAAYNDPARQEADYDAVGWTCPVDPQGRFQLKIGELEVGTYQLRLIACHDNGAKSSFAYDYKVDKDGRPPLEAFEYPTLLNHAIDAYQAADRQRLLDTINTLETRYGHVEIIKKKTACLRRLAEPGKLKSAGEIPASVKQANLSDMTSSHESVGWKTPLRNRTPTEADKGFFLEVGGEVYVSGFYAHALSRWAFDLGGQWKMLGFGYGLQDGFDGSAVFVILTDGKEVFRSNTVREHHVQQAEIDVTGAGLLELVVEDGGDGANMDWGVWLEPVLKR
ncbi:MAG: NPCBM/NEW2 domain-containing protein [Anaerohalosphaeraceae bacterium]